MTSIPPDDKNKTPTSTGSPHELTLDERLIKAIKSFETYKASVYPDGKSHIDPKTGKIIEELSVGFGHHLQKGDGLKVGDVVSIAKADALLNADIAKYKSVIRDWAEAHNVTLAPYEEDALVDLTFNEGPKTLIAAKEKPEPSLAVALEKRAHDSNATPDLAKADTEAILAAIRAWDKMHKGNEVVESPYLKKRRGLDTAMFVDDMQEVDAVTAAISKWNGTVDGIHVHKPHKKPAPEKF